MNNTIPNQYRYPGAKPFEVQDSAIFFGRKEDTEKLRELISVERMVVLYGKSGLGKSSLLNAGVLPLLQDYCIIPIRLHAKAENIATPLATTLAKIESESTGKEAFIETFAGALAPVWAKLNALQQQKNPPCICLVFDQFEELFTHDPAEIQAFKTALAEAFFEKVPQKVRNQWEVSRSELTEAQQKQLFLPIELKLVFAIRDDRMSFLDAMKDVFPNILQKTYKLAPLHHAQAEEAILYPAYARAAHFKVQPFDYEDDALDAILDTLSNQKGEIESPQLQIICRHAETLVENHKIAANDKGKIIIQRAHLGELSQIYRAYYLNMLAMIANNVERRKVREVIENELIYEPDERRIPCFEKIILDKGVSLQTLLWLVNEHHILRAEPNVGGGFTYELSHDVLVKPILAEKKLRREETERLRLAEEKAQAEAQKLAAVQALAKEMAQKAELEKALITAEKALGVAKTRTRYAIILGTISLIIAGIAWYFFHNAEQATIQAKKNEQRADSARIAADSANQRLMREVSKTIIAEVKAYHSKEEADSARVQAERDKAKAEAAEKAKEKERQSAEQKKKEAEAALAAKIKAENDKKALQFDDLLRQAERLCIALEYKLAQEKYNEALNLAPEKRKQEVREKMTRCK